MKKTFYIISLFLLSALTVNAETNLIITHLDATEKTEALSVLGKLTFSSDSLYLYSNQSQLLAQSALKDVRKITFSKETTQTSELKNTTISIYPNPTQESILIDGLKVGETIRIFSLQGLQMKQVDAQENTTAINVSELANGTYLLQVGTDILKFIKK